MTDQEFEKELAELMKGDASGKKKHTLRLRFWKNWSRKKKLVLAGVAVVVALFLFSQLAGGKKEDRKSVV